MKKMFLLACVLFSGAAFSSAAAAGFNFDTPSAGLALPAAPKAAIVAERVEVRGARTLECVSYSKEYKLRLMISSLNSSAMFSVLDSKAQGDFALALGTNFVMRPDDGGSDQWVSFEGGSADTHTVQIRFLKADLAKPVLRAVMAVSREFSDSVFVSHELTCY